MYSINLEKKKQEIEFLKEGKNFDNYSLFQLQQLPSFNGICELSFEEKKFLMLNIQNDDAIPLKYFWRNNYETLSLKLWSKISEKGGYALDIGAHTGIYTIIGNLNKNNNNIISIEPFYLNYCRLLSNLKLNNISTNNCFLAAVSNQNSIRKFSINTNNSYHTQAGHISEKGQFSVNTLTLDSLKLEKYQKIIAMKIDTEGHEIEILEGSSKMIETNKPDIIFEINESSLNRCINLLKKSQYKFYFINEENKKLEFVEKFSQRLKKEEGTNCFATVNDIKNYVTN